MLTAGAFDSKSGWGSTSGLSSVNGGGVGRSILSDPSEHSPMDCFLRCWKSEGRESNFWGEDGTGTTTSVGDDSDIVSVQLSSRKLPYTNAHTVAKKSTRVSAT